MSLSAAPETSAREAGLRYVSDDAPGLRRVRRGLGFGYRRPDGRYVRDKGQLAWIRSLAIPPAWTDVWVCADRRGHLQATGRDSRGRKVYRYHPQWRATRDAAKFDRLADFAEVLPRIRRRVANDLRQRGLTRRKVLALVVRLLDATALRIGNEAYAADNASFGLTTLRDRHVRIGGGGVRLRFRAKGGKLIETKVDDARLTRVVRRLHELPGQELFQYLDEDGKPQPIGSSDVNDYLAEISGQDVTAKDFRTWAGTVSGALALHEVQSGRTKLSNSDVAMAMREVGRELGNTPRVSRSAYVHPAVIDAYLVGGVAHSGIGANGGRHSRSTPRTSLSAQERAVLKLLRQAASKRSRARR